LQLATFLPQHHVLLVQLFVSLTQKHRRIRVFSLRLLLLGGHSI
jgi:hypothetical protein